MRLIRSASRGALRLVIVATFWWAAGMDAYGSEPCSHHDAVSVAQSGELHAPEGSSEPHEAQSPSDADGHTDHDDGPCTCITHCQTPGGDVSLTPATGAALEQPDISSGHHRPILGSVVLGPRHHLFELHLPNAPPHAT